MRYAKITFSGVTNRSTVAPGGTILPPVPNLLHPIYLPETSPNVFVTDGRDPITGFGLYVTYTPRMTFPEDHTELFYAGGSGTDWMLFCSIYTHHDETSITNNTNQFGGGELCPSGTGHAYIEIIEDPGITILSSRPVYYDNNLVWGFADGYWRWMTPGVDSGLAPVLAIGGGRYKQSVVAIGHGKVYYGDIT